jgi:hypothetical protein
MVALPLFLVKVGSALDGGLAWAALGSSSQFGDVVGVVLLVE